MEHWLTTVDDIRSGDSTKVSVVDTATRSQRFGKSLNRNTISREVAYPWPFFDLNTKQYT